MRGEAQGAPDDVAIIGMACVFPKAPDVRSFWENIVGRVDAIGDPPEDWGAESVYDPASSANDRIYTKRGGYLRHPLRFDPIKYGIMPRAVEGGEPEHFVALQVAHDALVDAGYGDRPFGRERTEVILGRGTYVNRGVIGVFQHVIVLDQVIKILAGLHPEYSPHELETLKSELKASLPPFNAETAAGVVHSVMCGRVANRLDLMGSAFTVDAACASSLIAVDLATTDLLNGKCDLALAGGIQISTTFPVVMVFCQLGALSRRGELRPFHPEADGTLLGEGAGMVVLKRRRDAERDGDRIYALVKGVGTASDGRAMGVLTPRVEGEELAMRRAYERTGVAPATIGLVEAHGTGTPVGDATEIEAMTRIFGRRDGKSPSCALGSVKSMIGHSVPAAGVAGLIKAALALYHKVLPATLHADVAHPKLDATALYLNGDTRPWIHGGPHPRRAAVSAFGFGGINAHAVLEERDGVEPRENLHGEWDSEVFILGGVSRGVVHTHGTQLRHWLKDNGSVTLRDLACALNCSLSREDAVRLAIVAASLPELDRKLAHALDRLADPACERIRELGGVYYFERPLAREGKLAFVFPGEGAQYPGMLADLCLHFPEVRKWFDLMDRAFGNHARGFLPSHVIFPLPGAAAGDEGQGKLWEMDGAIEAVFTANQALAALLIQLGVRPEAVVGHSTGEYSSLLVAGAVEIEGEAELIRYVLEGNAVTERTLRAGLVPPGVLLAVGGADQQTLEAMVAESSGDLHLAMDNCAHQVVLCGTEEAAARAHAALRQRGAICQRLPFSRAYHTPLFAPVCAELRPYYRQGKFVRPGITLYSCATAAPFPDDPEECREVALSQWERPVRFRETIERMYSDGTRIFVEVGPRGNLTAFLDDTLRGRPHLAVAANLRRRSGVGQLNHVVGELAAHGVWLELESLYARRRGVRLTADAIWRGDRLPVPSGRSAELSLGLPMLHGVRPQALRRPVREPGVAPAEPASPLLHVESPASPADAKREPPAPGLPVGIPASPGRVRATMREHFQTMEQFLGVQEEVVSAYLRGLRGNSRTAGPESGAAGGLERPALLSAPPAASERVAKVSPASPRPESAGPARPFVDTLLRHVPGEQVVARRTFELETDVFLRDHTLGPRVSTVDPGLTPLPVFPLALSLEIMAEVASLLVQGRNVTGFRSVRASRWVTLRSSRLTVEVEARVLDGAAVDVSVEIREAAVSGAPETRRPLVQGVVSFGPEPSGQAAPAPFSLRAERSSTWAPDELYREGAVHGMFHGPAFQGVASMDRLGEDGAEGTVRGLSHAPFLRSPATQTLLTDIPLLDAAGQVLGFWAADWLDRAFIVFPVGFEALELSGPLAPPQRATCRVRIKRVEPERVRADLEVVDGAGRCLLRIRGWEVKRFDIPEHFYKFRLAPATTVLSRSWRAPLTSLPEPQWAECCRLELPRSFLEVDEGIWRDVLAFLVLSRTERQAWRALGGTEARRTEWLLGRLAAKDAMRTLVFRLTGERVYPADIELEPDERGRPIPRGDWTRRVGGFPVVSLTHTRDLAAAVAVRCADGGGVGIDVERVRPFGADLVGVALAPEEAELLAAMSEGEREEWMCRMWCAKEAVGKAIGRGLSGAPRGLGIEEIEPDTGAVRIRLRDAVARELPQLAGADLRAQTGRDGDLIFATACA